MEMCDNCGISGNSVNLVEVISREGIVKLCKKCQEERNIPVIKKFDLSEFSNEAVEPPQTVYERLTKISGYDKKKEELSKDTLIKIPEIELTPQQREEDKQLREIVEKNALKELDEKNFRKDLIENFHWIIMRERRRKKLTKEEFARVINEPEVVINLAEKGFITEENSQLVDKIENYLKIKIRKKEELKLEDDVPKGEEGEFTSKKEVMPLFKRLFKGGVNFRSSEIEDLKIEDLKEVDEKFKK